MSVTLTVRGKPLTDYELGGARLLRELGLMAIRIIRTRTERGIGVHGTFQPLSKAYAKAKAKALGNSRADLTVSRRMLNDLQIVKTVQTEEDGEVTLGFVSQGRGASGGTFIQRSRSTGANDKAFYAEDGNHGVVRQFMDLTDAEMDQLEELVAKQVDEQIGRG